MYQPSQLWDGHHQEVGRRRAQRARYGALQDRGHQEDRRAFLAVCRIKRAFYVQFGLWIECVAR